MNTRGILNKGDTISYVLGQEIGKYKGGKLIARHSRLSDFSLVPVKPDNFSSERWFFGQIEFVRDDQKNIKGCRVSSGRVRNLWFQKMKN